MSSKLIIIQHIEDREISWRRQACNTDLPAFHCLQSYFRPNQRHFFFHQLMVFIMAHYRGCCTRGSCIHGAFCSVFMPPCRWQNCVCVLSVYPSVHLMQCLENTLREFLLFWYKYKLWLKDELIRIWLTKVKGQGHCNLTKHVFGHNSLLYGNTFQCLIG